MHGQGKLIYENGNKYEGSFYWGKKNGEGSFYWKLNSMTYSGYWLHDKMHGEGLIKTFDGKTNLLKFHNGKLVDENYSEKKENGRFPLVNTN